MQDRVTQKQVAAAAGVHSTTVSMVFRNHPSIPEETRHRIRELARKMGYMHDPMLSALAAYRTSHRPVAFHGTMVWMTNSGEGFDWKASPHFLECYKGIVARTKQHGYQVEEFDINEYRKNPKRLASIMHSRNIQGILLCPQPSAHTVIDLPWEHFSVVTFGYSLQAPKFNTVAFAFYRSIRLILERVYGLGYRRVGLALDPSDDARYDHNVMAGFLLYEFQRFGKLSIRPLVDNYRKNPKLLQTWLEKEKPDVIVCQDWRVGDLLKKLGYQPPIDIGLACAGSPAGAEYLSGIQETSRELAATAVDLLAAMIQRGERGIPAKPQQILIDGDWVNGTTLRENA
jgi:LacI family transcriptional regulator/LacI family repressor for deo operon, udp, cdd, tsx, nupC, and nupG